MNTQPSNTRTRRLTLRSVVGSMLGALFLAALLTSIDKPATAADITVYKSPACGGCGAWVDHLQRNGFEVTVHDRTDMQPIKDHLIPQAAPLSQAVRWRWWNARCSPMKVAMKW